MIVKQLITRLSFKNDESGYRKYKSTQNKAKRDSEQFVRSIKSDHISMHRRIIASHGRMARNMAGNLVRLKANSARAYNSMLSHARSTFSKIAASQQKASMGGMGKAAMGIGAAYAGYSALKGMGTSIFNAGAEYERLNAALVTVTGSQANASKEFAKLEKFAKSTPYNLDKSVEAFIKLKALGLDPSERSLKSYGNTASSMGKDLMQMIEAVADASTGEFERLKEFGIKTSRQGDNVTFTFRGVKTTVKNDAKQIQDYLLKLGEVQFAGGMERQAKTIGGLVSTMQDSFSALARKIWTGGLDVQAKKFVQWLTNAADNAIPFIKSLAPLKKYLPAVAGTLGFFLARFAGLKLIAAGGWLLKIVSAFRSLTLLSLGTFAMPAAIAAAVAGVIYLGYEIYKFATTGKGLIKNLSDRFPEFGKAVEALKQTIINTWVEVKPYAMEFWQLMKDLSAYLYEKLGETFKWLFKEVVVPMLIWGIKWLTQFIKDWVDGFKTMIQWGKDWHSGFKTIMNWFTKVIGDVSAGFSDWKTNLENTFNYIRNQFPWVSKLVSGVAKLFGYGGGSGGGSSGGSVNTEKFTGKTFAMKDTSGKVHQLPGWMARVIKPGDREALDTDAFFDSWRKRKGKWVKGGHRSFDFHGRVGAPVYAAQGGTVIRSATEKQAGWLADILIKQVDGKVLRYLHVNPLGFKPGQKIEAGQQLGNIINLERYGKGRSHVHFGLTGAGGRLNPQTYNIEQHNHIHGPTDPESVGKKVKDKTREALDKTARSAPKRTNGLAYTQ